MKRIVFQGPLVTLVLLACLWTSAPTFGQEHLAHGEAKPLYDNALQAISEIDDPDEQDQRHTELASEVIESGDTELALEIESGQLI